MAKYLLMYHGGLRFKSQEAGKTHMAEWMKWMESLGPAVADRGFPIAISKTIASDGKVTDGAGASPPSGYTLLSADNIDAAVKLAQVCPHLKIGGSIEVHEGMDMEM